MSYICFIPLVGAIPRRLALLVVDPFQGKGFFGKIRDRVRMEVPQAVEALAFTPSKGRGSLVRYEKENRKEIYRICLYCNGLGKKKW